MTDHNDTPPSDNIGKYLLGADARRSTKAVETAIRQVPLTLQPFFREDSDLEAELLQRFPSMPLMSHVRFRDVYYNGERGIATLSAQDGSSTVLIDVSKTTNEIQFAFIYGSMLSLRFLLDELSDLDRQAWMSNMQNNTEDVVFLWGQSRWAKDYVICVPHKYYISLLAFSPHHFEAAVRVTPAIGSDLFDWLREFWFPDATKPTGDSNDDTPDSASSILSSW